MSRHRPNLQLRLTGEEIAPAPGNDSGQPGQPLSIGTDRFQGGGLTVDKSGIVEFAGSATASGQPLPRHRAGSSGTYDALQGLEQLSLGPSSTGSSSAGGASSRGGMGSATGAGQPSGVSFDDLDIERKLGSGASASVYLAKHKLTGQRYALKCISLYEKGVRDQLIAELNTLYAAECDALVGFYGATYREGTVAVVLEYMDCRGLDFVLQQAPGHVIPEWVIAGIAFQVLWGLGYLAHERRVHRDVKPANLLVNSSGQVKLTDFGISRQIQDSIMAKTFVGSFRYMSPERISHAPYGPTSDIWALGLVLLEAALGRYPYPAEDSDGGPASQIAMVMTLAESDPPIPPPGPQSSAAFIDFLHKCLARDPAKRASAMELLESPWLFEHGVASLEAAQERVRQWLGSIGLVKSS